MKMTGKAKSKIFVVGQAQPPAVRAVAEAARKEVWRWGSDNRLPEALAALSRSSTVHRRIINDKADYISGSGLSVDAGAPRTAELVAEANGQGQTLRNVVQRLALDRCLLGNAFLEVVTDPKRSFLALYHQDATRCRLSRDDRHVVLHHDWKQYRTSEAILLPLYPAFEPRPDGTLRAVIHYKDYEPMFEHYGVPKYIAGMGASAIVWKTDRWNISRLDNSFQPSGVMVLDGDTDSEQEAAEIARLAEERFAGKPDRQRHDAFRADHHGERRGLEVAPRPGVVGYHRGALMVPDAERDGVCDGVFGGSGAARVQHCAQHADPGRAAGDHRTDPAGLCGGVPRGGAVSDVRQPSAVRDEAGLHAGLGGAQGGRLRLRSGRPDAAAVPRSAVGGAGRFFVGRGCREVLG